MTQTVNQHDFIQAFADCGRREQFSYKALTALFEDFENFEYETGETIVLDPIAICCEQSEYSSAIECIVDAGYDYDPQGDGEFGTAEADALEYLRDNTQVIEFSGGIIIVDF